MQHTETGGKVGASCPSPKWCSHTRLASTAVHVAGCGVVLEGSVSLEWLSRV